MWTNVNFSFLLHVTSNVLDVFASILFIILCFVFQPYLSSTRSLSPMSGLFGSIWAPQSDVYESCCPVSATTQHSTQVENQAVICKQEYYPRFNPFRAYMNLDIWTSAANRNANFPLSRDSGYCGNMWKQIWFLKCEIKILSVLITRISWLLN